MKKVEILSDLSICLITLLLLVVSFSGCEELTVCEGRGYEDSYPIYFDLRDLTHEEKIGNRRTLTFNTNADTDYIGPICTSKTIDFEVTVTLKNETLPEPVPSVRVYWYYDAPGPSEKILRNYFNFYLDVGSGTEVVQEKKRVSLPSSSSEFHDATYIYLGIAFNFESKGDLAADMEFLNNSVYQWKYKVIYTRF